MTTTQLACRTQTQTEKKKEKAETKQYCVACAKVMCETEHKMDCMQMSALLNLAQRPMRIKRNV